MRCGGEKEIYWAYWTLSLNRECSRRVLQKPRLRNLVRLASFPLNAMKLMHKPLKRQIQKALRDALTTGLG